MSDRNSTTLGDIAEIISGSTPKSNVNDYWDGDIAWATPNDLSKLENKEIFTTARLLTQQGLESCSARILPPNSVLFTSRAPIGHIAINKIPMATNQGFKSFIPDTSKVDPNYLYYWLKEKKPYIQHLGRGATFKEVSKQIVAAITINLPPLQEQRRIAKELDLSIKMRDLARSRISKINQIEASLFYMFFGDPLINSKGWDQKRIKDIANIQTGNTPARANKNYYGSSIEWIKSDNLNNNDNYPTKAKEMLSKEGSRVGRIAQKDSILVTCIAGSPSCIGNSCLLNRAVAFNQQINSIELFTEDPIFIYFQIKLYKRLIQNASNNSMKGMVNKKNFGEIHLITPPISIQRKFVEKINLLKDFSLLINRSESLSSELLSSSSCKLMGRSL